MKFPGNASKASKANERIKNVSDVLKEGDVIKVKLIGIDHKTGKFKLSRKVLMPKPEGMKPQPGESNGQN